jgi:hypothetical protein
VVDQQSTFPCPCCGYLSFDQPPGSYEICEICFWEDDELQLEYATTLAGGANRPTLHDAQRNFLKFGACEPEMVGNVRSPSPSDIRDPTWRLIDPLRDRFENWGDRNGTRPLTRREALYYWRPSFWRLDDKSR